MHSVSKIADYINATSVVGDSDLIIKGLCGIDSGKDGCISYVHNQQYFKYLSNTKASAIIINKDFFPENYNNKILIKVNNAVEAFSKLIHLFHVMAITFTTNTLI